MYFEHLLPIKQSGYTLRGNYNVKLLFCEIMQYYIIITWVLLVSLNSSLKPQKPLNCIIM